MGNLETYILSYMYSGRKQPKYQLLITWKGECQSGISDRYHSREMKTEKERIN